MSGTENNNRKTISAKSGVFDDLANHLKLILRLMADSRVNPLLKLLPLGSLVYFLIPDLVPGPIDDLAIIWVGAYLFIELCPPEVVEDHMQALEQVVPGEWHDPTDEMNEKSDVIDADYWETKE